MLRALLYNSNVLASALNMVVILYIPFVLISSSNNYIIAEDNLDEELKEYGYYKTIKSWYKKIFGEPITEFELSTREVIFSTKQKHAHTASIYGKYTEDRYLSVTRTSTNIIAEYREERYPNRSRYKLPNFKVEFDIDEWQNFIKALSELHIHKWKNVYHVEALDDDVDDPGTCWRLEIVSHNADKLNIFSGCRAWPPNWYEFMKVMKDLEAKIKEKVD